MKQSEITQIINDTLEAVENSELGQIEYIQGDGKKVMNYLPFQAFCIILSSIIPKQVGGSLFNEMIPTSIDKIKLQKTLPEWCPEIQNSAWNNKKIIKIKKGKK